MVHSRCIIFLPHGMRQGRLRIHLNLTPKDEVQVGHETHLVMAVECEDRFGGSVVVTHDDQHLAVLHVQVAVVLCHHLHIIPKHE